MFGTKTKVTAAEIHAEVEKQGNMLLAEVESVLASTDAVLKNKAEVLRTLGFTSTPEARTVRITDVKTLARDPKVQADVKAINVLGRIFLTNAQFSQLCAKYGLVDHPVLFFNRSVPDKNLRAILRFKEDVRSLAPFPIKAWRVGGISWYSVAHKKEYSKAIIEYLDSVNHIVPGYDEGDAADNLMRVVHKMSNGSRLKLLNCIETSSLRIAAPENEFNVMSFSTLNPFKNKVHDPIVTYPFGSGRVVITAWGPEADDPMLKG